MGDQPQHIFTGSTTDKLEEISPLTWDCIIKASRTLQEVGGSLTDNLPDVNQELFCKLCGGDFNRGDMLLIPESRSNLYKELERMLPNVIMERVRLDHYVDRVVVIEGSLLTLNSLNKPLTP